ncbi:MAG: multidrug effflux MFS transporter [Campylobacteraceae bacterium]|jgi:DHA1 family bicyclomycin/chloramphenicol resistance-like MFS transporter|nr:multidrug effflux MFS transporter [Campylobacteraceae bacterium]
MKALTERQLVFILAALSAITPLAIDMYLPAINVMSKSLNVPEPQVAMSISIFFFGLAAGQLFGGPISDAYGRRPIVIIGLALFCLSSAGIIFAGDIHLLLVLRFVQAFGGGLATVNVAATVRDMFSGNESARIFSMIGSITIIAPLVAPALGFIIILLFKTWEAIFVILTLYSFLALYFYKRHFKTQNLTEKRKVTPIKNYIEVLTSPKPMIIMTALVISSSGLYALLASASIIYINYFNLSKFMFVVCFSLNVSVMIITSKINAKIVRRFSSLKLLRFGIKMQVLIAVVLMILHKSENIFVIAPLIALFTGMLGFIFGNAISIILEYFPKTSASANALLGVLQYSVGALAGLLVNFFDDGTLFPLIFAIASSSFVGAVILLIGTKHAKVLV